MARSVNKVILVGIVGRDPETVKDASEEKVVRLTLATRRRVPTPNGFHERTEWHRLRLVGRLATFAQEHIRKGDRIYAEGRIEYDSYEKNGVTIPITEIVTRELVILGATMPGQVLPAESEV